MYRNLLPLALLPVLACYPNTRAHADSDAPSDADTDSDSDTDTDADSDTDTDTDTDTDPPPFIDYTTAYGGTMVAITAGTFEMGSEDYGPVHTVTLTHDFWIGQTEVTQAQYLAGTGASPSYFSSCGSTCPVEQVSWADAAVYANALSAAEGLERCYTATGSDLSASLSGDPYACEGYRLPTEAEWEYAARGGESYTYSGSETVGDVAWTEDNSGSTTHPVAGKAANAFGLYDMSGNVFEWPSDWYGPYAADATADPVGAASSSERVYRGGGWYNPPANARVAFRSGTGPFGAYSAIGLRLARSAP